MLNPLVVFSTPPPCLPGFFDGGDCCECTCENPFDYEFACKYTYNINSFDCKDPTVSCDDEDLEDDDDDDAAASMSYEFILWEHEEWLPTVDGAVEVGTKIDVGVSATGYDARPGMTSGEWGCGEAGGSGCAPANTRDDIVSDIESRWSCAAGLVDDGGPCQIEYTFGVPQDIVDIQVAFWKADERTRELEVSYSQRQRNIPVTT